jgi:hypothetical protein
VIDISTMDENAPVFLLLNGKLVLHRHNIDDPIAQKTMMVVKPGSFVGVPELDKNQSNLPLNFLVVYSHTTTLIKMSRSLQ